MALAVLRSASVVTHSVHRDEGPYLVRDVEPGGRDGIDARGLRSLLCGSITAASPHPGARLLLRRIGARVRRDRRGR